ncbi:IucA/IucC family protein [Nocardia salmonicida]|uniref:Siderophore synthetase component n=1 Tax=Nocardia fluminea TaxID=134984 RepID=A0A2N3VH83_9NOCA|nr:IucA/IucC family protein [Nocardia fluminea]PKV80987.1 siderophore synthetase component [Nocardia fluminea]
MTALAHSSTRDPLLLPDADESALVRRVLATMLREDVLGMRTRSTTETRPDGRWLRLTRTVGAESITLCLPVEPDGFLCTDTVRQPQLWRDPDGTRFDSVAEVVGVFAELADPVDRSGFDDFGAECASALSAMRLHTATRGRVTARLIAAYGCQPDRWTGTAALGFDTFAARHDHPVYPAARARTGLTTAQLRSYAPEFHPTFALRWLAVPVEHVTIVGALDLPAFWPTPAQLGAPEFSSTHVLLPVHPLSIGPALDQAIRSLGLDGRAVLLGGEFLDVVPTLSMRTVACLDAPGEYLKLPLAIATLGVRNVRTIRPRTLSDGALCQRLLTTLLAGEARFRERILLVDESVYAHAAHELLAVLCRRDPPAVRGCVVVPMAALLSRAHDGRPVIDHLADRFYGGDVITLFDAWLELLFDWQATLFGYGMALESHQQNVSLVLDDRGGPTLRLLFKDNDTPRVHTTRLRHRLGDEPAAFADPRINVDDDRPLTDLFTTITVHLCAGAFAFALADLGRAPLSDLLGIVRDRLEQAVARLDTPCADRLRADVLEAPSLPVKAMVSAATLFSKQRSGAVDVNKHYTSGPNYLRNGAAR